MSQYFLYECSLGFSLFKLQSLDKLSLQDPKLQAAISSFQDFKKIVSLEASQLFQGHNVAFDTVQALKEGRLPESLSAFLTSHLPSSKTKNLSLAVQDKVLANLLNSQMELKCVSGELYLEIFRGLRNHIIGFLGGEAAVDKSRLAMANLGVGHAVARHNVKFDVRRQDKTVTNAFGLLDMMEKNLNTFSMRLREGYGWHFPELDKIVSDNEAYARLIASVGVG